MTTNFVTNEIEETNEEEVIIDNPFNPNDIKIDIKNRTLNEIIDKLEHNEINLFTVYQRRPHLWNNAKKSRLIESILLGMPIPAFYFEAQQDLKTGNTIWQVVDGLQRISTIQHFIFGKENSSGQKEFLALEGLDFLKQFEGKKYADLPRNLVRRIKNYDILIYIIKEGTPEQVKYNLFKRINTAGIVLEPQEIRHALNQGRAAEYVAELAELDEFKQATDDKVPSDRMQDRDFANRFLAFYLLDLKTYNSDLDAFLHQVMSNINKGQFSEQQLEGVRFDYKKALITAYQIFENDAFRKRQNVNDRRRPINKALFDSISVNFAKLTEEQCKELVNKKEAFKTELIRVSNEDSDFWRSISTATGQKSNVTKRFSTIKKIIEKVLND